MSNQVKKYSVSVTRHSTQTVDFNIEADNVIEAKQKALDAAYDYDFSDESGAEYEVDQVLGGLGHEYSILYTMNIHSDYPEILHFECEAKDFREAQIQLREHLSLLESSQTDLTGSHIFGTSDGFMMGADELASLNIFIENIDNQWATFVGGGRKNIASLAGKPIISECYDEVVGRATLFVEHQRREDFEDNAYDYLMERVEDGELCPEDLCRMIVTAGLMTTEEWKSDMKDKMGIMDENLSISYCSSMSL